ncbi:MAG: ABC transporter ATP-binding protein [bacterium]|nr:ABC transporter ATP-binding protein [bacterium]
MAPEQNVSDRVDAALELHNVTRCFGAKVAVDGLSLRIPYGELFAFLGPNGAGKTTTIKMIVGLLRPGEGTVTVCGHELGRDGLCARARMAYVPDQPFLYDKLTGREFLHFVAQMYRITDPERDRTIRELAARFDMADFLDHLSETYSHGMKQKVVLAAALLHDPALLIVDEPMVGLDPRTARQVRDLFVERTRRGGTAFITTHTLAVAEAVADRIGIIHRGRLIALGTLEELRRRAEHHHSLEEIFLQLTEADDETCPRP